MRNLDAKVLRTYVPPVAGTITTQAISVYAADDPRHERAPLFTAQVTVSGLQPNVVVYAVDVRYEEPRT